MNLRNILWHPLLSGVLLATTLWNVYLKGWNELRLITVCVLVVWVALSILNLILKGAVVKWIYSSDD